MMSEPSEDRERAKHARAALERAGRKLAAARKAADDAFEATRVVALVAIRDGVPEAVAARLLGVNRLTVRKWLGKGKR